MAILRMQDPRQLYGLGSLVKKAIRGVKKIVKSPIGKAALIGGGAYFAPTLWGGAKGLAGWKGLASKFGPSIMGKTSGGGGFFTKGLGRFLNPWSSGKFSGKHAFGLGAAALTAMPFLMKGDEEEEEEEESWTNVPSSIADIRNQAKNYYTLGSAGSNLNFMPQKQFVDANYYAADGGRVGLLNGGEAGQEQIEQMLMAEYIKYKNQGGQLTFEQFVQAVMQQQEGGMEQPQELPQEGEVIYAADGGRIGLADGGLDWDDYGSGTLESQGAGTGSTGVGNGGDNTNNTVVVPPNNTVVVPPEGNTILENIDTNTIKNNVNDMYLNNLISKRNTSTDDETDNLYAGNYSQNAVTGQMFGQGMLYDNLTPFQQGQIDDAINTYGTTSLGTIKSKDGGRIGLLSGGLLDDDEDETTYNPYAATKMYRRMGKQEGGIMESEAAEEMINMNGQEKDYRETGGFVNLGGKERADDVPARLSKNEFVFTADAVRAAGGGDIDAGSEVMQNMMDNLEQGGEISEESQGLEGAQAMYDQQQMLQSRIA